MPPFVEEVGREQQVRPVTQEFDVQAERLKLGHGCDGSIQASTRNLKRKRV
jgi:hypothetical protein